MRLLALSFEHLHEVHCVRSGEGCIEGVGGRPVHLCVQAAQHGDVVRGPLSQCLSHEALGEPPERLLGVAVSDNLLSDLLIGHNICKPIATHDHDIPKLQRDLAR